MVHPLVSEFTTSLAKPMGSLSTIPTSRTRRPGGPSSSPLASTRIGTAFSTTTATSTNLWRNLFSPSWQRHAAWSFKHLQCNVMNCNVTYSIRFDRTGIGIDRGTTHYPDLGINALPFASEQQFSLSFPPLSSLSLHSFSNFNCFSNFGIEFQEGGGKVGGLV